jgi:tetratricopeptide (TPR) repeat protein
MSLRDVASAWVVAAMGVGVVAATQPGLARSLHAAKAREDVYLFPPPAQLKVATLGYRAAVVDLLWVKLRIEYGMHLVEKRPFPDAPHYFDALLELEPDYAPVFKYVDTMLCFHEPNGTAEDARATRAYLERGIAARPYDHDVWLRYGQFLAFMAASYLSSKEEIERWRLDGAAALARAVELGDDPDRSLAAATLLSNQGARSAAVRALERAYALTDDETLREHISVKLASLQADDVRDRAKENMAFIENMWRSDWPFLRRSTMLVVGPERSTASCAGQHGADDPGCSVDWTERIPAKGLEEH